MSIEVFRYLIVWMYNYCYGYAVLSYLEYPILLLQQVVLLYFILKFQNLITVEVIMCGMLLLITVALFMNGVLPREVLTYLLVSNQKLKK